jgi:hypothetical protein
MNRSETIMNRSETIMNRSETIINRSETIMNRSETIRNGGRSETFSISRSWYGYLVQYKRFIPSNVPDNS